MAEVAVRLPVLGQASQAVEREPLRLDVLSGLESFLALEAEWRALHLESRSDNPFLSWEWVGTWARHFWSDGVTVLTIRRGGRLRGVAPFHRRTYRFGAGAELSCLQLFGPSHHQHLFELREPLLGAGDEEQVLRALVEGLDRLEGWDWVELSGHGPRLALLQSTLAAAPGLETVVDAELPMPVLRLAGSWNEQRRLMGRNLKESIRHSQNSLGRTRREYSIEWNCEADVDGALRSFLELHRLRSEVRGHTCHPDTFRDPAVRDLLRDAGARLIAAGRLRVPVLKIDGRPAAARLTLTAGDSLYLYYSGFDPEWWRQGVMTLLTARIVAAAIDAGYRRVNLSPSIDQAKHRWHGEDLGWRRFLVLRRGAVGGVAVRAIVSRRRAKRALKVLLAGRQAVPQAVRRRVAEW